MNAEAIVIGFRRKIGNNKHDYYSLKQQSSLFYSVLTHDSSTFIINAIVRFQMICIFIYIYILLTPGGPFSLIFIRSRTMAQQHFYEHNNLWTQSECASKRERKQESEWISEAMEERVSVYHCWSFIIAIILKWNVHHAISARFTTDTRDCLSL